MRNLLVRILATALALYAVNYFVGGFQITNTWQAYLLTAAIFILFNAIASPLIKLLLLPINLLTLGLFRWLTNVLVLYLFDLLYGGITITAYDFTGYQGQLIGLPPMHLSLFWTLVLSSFILSLTFSLISTLFNSD